MTKRNSQNQRLTPSKFLKLCGLKSISPRRAFGPAFGEALSQAGGDPAACAEYLRTAAETDKMFINDKVAGLYVSTSYDRIHRHLRDFETVPGFPRTIRRVADLGGGHGIVAMWLAYLHPEASFVVYDHSSKALDFGCRIAKSLGIRNVEFVQKSFKQLAEETPTHDCDLVLFYNGFFLAGIPTGHDAFLYREMPTESKCENFETMAHAATAMANLLSANGVGVFSGIFYELGLSHQCVAFRQANLNIDWPTTHLTICRNSTGLSVIDNCYLFLKHGGPRITDSGYEDARAILASSDPSWKDMILESGLLESFSEMFSSGKTLMTIEAKFPSGGKERLQLILKSGLILCELTSTQGYREGTVLGAARVSRFIAYVRQTVVEWQHKPRVQVKVVYAHREFQKMALRGTDGWIPTVKLSE